MVYACSICGQDTQEINGQVLSFDGNFTCKRCYMKLKGADLTEIKNILLRIEKKIDGKLK